VIDGLMINEHIYLFFLILSRYLGMMLLTPIFSSRVILYQIKILVAVSLAVLTFPLVVGNYPAVYPDSNLLVIIEIISEASIGLFMGLAVFLVFSPVPLSAIILSPSVQFIIS